MFSVEFLAAAAVVIGLLVLFRALSSRGQRRSTDAWLPPSEQSVADEAEQWLRQRTD